jgi:hypothetical protein
VAMLGPGEFFGGVPGSRFGWECNRSHGEHDPVLKGQDGSLLHEQPALATVHRTHAGPEHPSEDLIDQVFDSAEALAERSCGSPATAAGRPHEPCRGCRMRRWRTGGHDGRARHVLHEQVKRRVHRRQRAARIKSALLDVVLRD